MKKTFLREGKERIAAASVFFSGFNQGASQAEISYLEKLLQLKLPEAYKEALLWCGKGWAIPIPGEQSLMDDAMFLQKAMRSSLRLEEIGEELPEGAFFFHQGYLHVDYFFPDKGEDPPVRRIWTASNRVEKWTTFSEWFADQAELWVESWES